MQVVQWPAAYGRRLRKGDIAATFHDVLREPGGDTLVEANPCRTSSSGGGAVRVLSSIGADPAQLEFLQVRSCGRAFEYSFRGRGSAPCHGFHSANRWARLAQAAQRSLIPPPPST